MFIQWKHYLTGDFTFLIRFGFALSLAKLLNNVKLIWYSFVRFYVKKSKNYIKILKFRKLRIWKIKHKIQNKLINIVKKNIFECYYNLEGFVLEIKNLTFAYFSDSKTWLIFDKNLMFC